MSEWQPIETAPKNEEAVHLGRWEFNLRFGEKFWAEAGGRVWEKERGAFPWSRERWVRTFDGTYYTHWKPLPEPPK